MAVLARPRSGPFPSSYLVVLTCRCSGPFPSSYLAVREKPAAEDLTKQQPAEPEAKPAAPAPAASAPAAAPEEKRRTFTT